MPKRRIAVATRETHGFKWLRNPNVTRPLLAKGLWNGTAVSVFLATAETLNNVVILSVVPIASMSLASGTTAMATMVFAVGLGIGAALTLCDALFCPVRKQ